MEEHLLHLNPRRTQLALVAVWGSENQSSQIEPQGRKQVNTKSTMQSPKPQIQCRY